MSKSKIAKAVSLSGLTIFVASYAAIAVTSWAESRTPLFSNKEAFGLAALTAIVIVAIEIMQLRKLRH